MQEKKKYESSQGSNIYIIKQHRFIKRILQVEDLHRVALKPFDTSIII